MKRKSSNYYDEPDLGQTMIDWSDGYVAYFDGLCEPINPGGVATFGVVVKKSGKTVFEQSGLAFAKPWTDEASNNVAEYSAAIHALEWLKSNGLQNETAVLRGDSRLIINQLKGGYKVKAKRIIELHRRASKLVAEFTRLKLEWVDRSRNSEADGLSRLAYRRFRSESAKRKEMRDTNSF
jgi:ribonuclease HI